MSILRAPLTRGSLALTVSRATSGLLLMIASVLVARAAGASTLGVFGLAITIGVYASTIADLGVSAYLLPELGRTPRERWPALWAEAVRFELRSAAPLATVYVLVVVVTTHGSERLALLAAAAWWLTARVSSCARSVFVAAERVGYEAIATVVEAAVSLAAIAAFLQASHSAALSILGLAVGAAVGLAIRLYGVTLLGITGGNAERGASMLARTAVPFAAFTILTVVYLRIDVVLLSILRSTREVGLYQPPVRIVTALLILPDALAWILLGRAARAPEHRTTKLRQEQLLAVGVPLGLLLVALCAVFGKDVLGATYGHEFREAWLALTLLAGTVPLALVSALNGNALTARGFQWTRVGCLSIASVCAVGLAIPAIERFGYAGAAGVSVVNEVVLAAAYGVGLIVLVGREALVLPVPRFLRRPRSA